jgi:uncharacterized protein YecT (DUF1311 family)
MLNYFRVFRRHAALLVVAIEELCLLLAPCLTTKSIGNIFNLIMHHHASKLVRHEAFWHAPEEIQRMRVRPMIGACLWMACVSAATAQVADTEVANQQACAEVAALELPFADQVSDDDAKRLYPCESDKFYYAVGSTPDFEKARLCAQLEIADENLALFGSNGVLMMVYANGEGVERNIPLAKKFACLLEGAPAELEGRLKHLDEIAANRSSREANPDKAERIDLCDDITSGYMMGACAAHDQAAVLLQRTARWKAVTDALKPAQQTALAALRASATAYFASRVENEVDNSGTMRGAMSIGEGNALEDGLLNHLDQFQQGHLPKFGASELAAADAELNDAYTKARAAAVFQPGAVDGPLGTVRPDGIRAVERNWIKYRDAWVAFGKVRYPKVSADSWRTLFTQERTAQLKELVDGP